MIIIGNFIASTLLSDDKQILTVYLLLLDCLFVVAFCDRKFSGGNHYILEYLKISFSVAVST